MALCKNCLFYSEGFDELNRDFNDIGNPEEHFCSMYRDAIPDGVYNGVKDCEYYEEKGERA